MVLSLLMLMVRLISQLIIRGTLPTWIDLKRTNNHDNGYFGIAGVNGSLELGNRRRS
ncbi:hypothetical protein [Lactococcus lactis]